METKEKKNEGKKDLINVRDIADYLYCQRKVFLRKIKKVKEKAHQGMIKGGIKHRILDQLNIIEEGIIKSIKEKLSEEDLKNFYRKELLILSEKAFKSSPAYKFGISFPDLWKELWTDFSKEVELKIKSISKLIDKNIFEKELWERLEPKYVSEMKIENLDLGLIGKIDRVIISKKDKQEKYIPCEIKSSILKNKKPFFPELIQLASYALLLEKNFDQNIKYGYIEYKNKKLKIEISDELKNKVLNILNNIKNFSYSSHIPKIESNFNKCRYCGLREICFKEQ